MFSEVLAAFVVRTFALVATFMPINPANADIKAPTTKETATSPVELASFSPLKNSITATATTKIANTLYSAFKKAIAPSAMFLAIIRIFSVPSSCFVTHADLINIKTNPMIANTGKINKMFSITKLS